MRGEDWPGPSGCSPKSQISRRTRFDFDPAPATGFSETLAPSSCVFDWLFPRVFAVYFRGCFRAGFAQLTGNIGHGGAVVGQLFRVVSLQVRFVHLPVLELALHTINVLG